jgi:hypothetical protein
MFESIQNEQNVVSNWYCFPKTDTQIRHNDVHNKKEGVATEKLNVNTV